MGIAPPGRSRRARGAGAPGRRRLEPFRAGLGALLASLDGMVVVGDATDGDEAVALALDLQPDVVLMDLHMPGRNGIEATRDDRVRRPAHRRARPHDARGRRVGLRRRPGRVRAGTSSRARGRPSCCGRSGRSPRAAPSSAPRSRAGWSGFFAVAAAAAIAAAAFPELTAREREILDLVARGRANGQIADAARAVDQDGAQPRLERLHQDPGRRPRAGDRQGARGGDRRRDERDLARARAARRRGVARRATGTSRLLRDRRHGRAALLLLASSARGSSNAHDVPSSGSSRRRPRARPDLAAATLHAAARRARGRSAASPSDSAGSSARRRLGHRAGRRRARSTRSTRTTSTRCRPEEWLGWVSEWAPASTDRRWCPASRRCCSPTVGSSCAAGARRCGVGLAAARSWSRSTARSGSARTSSSRATRSCPTRRRARSASHSASGGFS